MADRGEGSEGTYLGVENSVAKQRKKKRKKLAVRGSLLGD